MDGLSELARSRLSQHDREFLYRNWVPPDPVRSADELLKNGCSVSLKQAREAQLISTEEMASRLGMSPNAYRLLESREAKQNASFASLTRAAEAMGCKCVTTIRPQHGESFKERLWAALVNGALETPWLQKLSDRRLPFAVGRRMTKLLLDPKFRQLNHWSRVHGQGRRRWYD